MVATVMIALISTIARIYKDSKWWCGKLRVRAIGRFSVRCGCWCCRCLAFAVYERGDALPWTNQKMSAFRTDNVVSQLNLVKSGSFQTTKNGERTVFVGQVKTGVLPEFEQIFVAQQQTDKIDGDCAVSQNAGERRWSLVLILENGRQYLLEQEKEQVSSMRFGRYGLSLEDLIKVDVGAIKENRSIRCSPMSYWTKVAQRR